MRWRRFAGRLALGFVWVVCALAWARPALACTPPPGGLPHYTATDRTLAAALVVEGTVIAVQTGFPEIAAIDVKRYLKGIGPRLIAVSGYGDSSVCLSAVSAGQAGVFFIQGDEARGYSAFYLSQFDAVAPADAATLAAVLAASGQAPRTDFLPYRLSTADVVLTRVRGTPPAGQTLTPAPLPPLNLTLTQAAATRQAASLTAAPRPIPIARPPAQPTQTAPDTSLIFLSIGGGLGCLAGVGLGLGLGLAISAYWHRKE